MRGQRDQPTVCLRLSRGCNSCVSDEFVSCTCTFLLFWKGAASLTAVSGVDRATTHDRRARAGVTTQVFVQAAETATNHQRRHSMKRGTRPRHSLTAFAEHSLLLSGCRRISRQYHRRVRDISASSKIGITHHSSLAHAQKQTMLTNDAHAYAHARTCTVNDMPPRSGTGRRQQIGRGRGTLRPRRNRGSASGGRGRSGARREGRLVLPGFPGRRAGRPEARRRDGAGALGARDGRRGEEGRGDKRPNFRRL